MAQKAPKRDDTKSLLMNPTITFPVESYLRVHFYHLNSRSPWWLRWFWRPKPLYGHCSVEWDIYVHNMTLREATGLHPADEWHKVNPPDTTLVTPFKVSFNEASDLVRKFEGESINCWHVFLWWSHLRRKHVPMSCAALVSAWIDMSVGSFPQQVRDFLDLDSDQLNVGTPDELYWTLLQRLGWSCIQHETD